jgi:hypothetical protein
MLQSMPSPTFTRRGPLKHTSIVDQTNSAPECCLSVGDMIQVVANLGPRSDVFNESGWDRSAFREVIPPSLPYSKGAREKVLFRLLEMLRTVLW